METTPLLVQEAQLLKIFPQMSLPQEIHVESLEMFRVSCATTQNSAQVQLMDNQDLILA